MVDLKEAGELNQLKKDLFCIEGIFHAMNAGSFPIKVMDGLHMGLEYIGKIHTELLAKIGPEEVAKMRNPNGQPPPPPPNPQQAHPTEVLN